MSNLECLGIEQFPSRIHAMFFLRLTSWKQDFSSDITVRKTKTIDAINHNKKWMFLGLVELYFIAFLPFQAKKDMDDMIEDRIQWGVVWE